jgi:hypothetical protein
VIARHVGAPLALAGAVLILGLATVIGGLDALHPAWYLWLSAVLSPLAVLGGAYLRLRGGPDYRPDAIGGNARDQTAV